MAQPGATGRGDGGSDRGRAVKQRKRARGRPLQFGERAQRYQITIPPKDARVIRKVGAGSLSAGVRALLQIWKTL